MKQLLVFSLLMTLFLTPASAPAQSYTTGDTLAVVAQSGLRLRTSPHTDAGTIRILDYGTPVRVLNTFGFDAHHSGTSGWLEGHWIHVSAKGTEGYLFDAYLSSLDVPTHEDELCYASLRFTAAVQSYLTRHYPVLTDETGIEHREDVDQCVTYHRDNITMTVTEGSGWYKTDVLFEGYRLTEVVNLLRAMIVGREMLQAFEDSLTFYRNRNGQVDRITAGHAEYPISIRANGNTVEVSLTELIPG